MFDCRPTTKPTLTTVAVTKTTQPLSAFVSALYPPSLMQRCPSTHIGRKGRRQSLEPGSRWCCALASVPPDTASCNTMPHSQHTPAGQLPHTPHRAEQGNAPPPPRHDQPQRAPCQRHTTSASLSVQNHKLFGSNALLH